MELFFYKKSKKLIMVTESFKEDVIKRGIAQHKIHVITNGVNQDLFFPREKNHSLIKKYRLENKFVVTYAGILSYSQDKYILCIPYFQGESNYTLKDYFCQVFFIFFIIRSVTCAIISGLVLTVIYPQLLKTHRQLWGQTECRRNFLSRQSPYWSAWRPYRGGLKSWHQRNRLRPECERRGVWLRRLLFDGDWCHHSCHGDVL